MQFDELFFLENYFKKVIKSTNPDIKKLVEQLSIVTDFKIKHEQIKLCLKYLTKEAPDTDKCSVLNTLAFIYINLTQKQALKKTISRILIPYENKELLTEELSKCITTIIEMMESQKEDIKKIIQHNQFLNGLNCSMELDCVVVAISNNFESVFDHTFRHLRYLVDYAYGKKSNQAVLTVSQAHAFINNSAKFILYVLQKCDNCLDRKRQMDLLRCCFDIIYHENIVFECKANCGHLIALLLSNLPEDVAKLSKFKDYPYLDLLLLNREPSVMLDELGLSSIKNLSLLEVFKVCCYLGVLIVAPPKVLWTHTIGNEMLLRFMFRELVQSSRDAKSFPGKLLGISRAISSLSNHLGSLSEEEMNGFFTEALNYIIIYLDDKMEVVRTHTKTLLRNLIKLALEYKEKGNSKLLEDILQWQLKLGDCNIRYTGLVVLSSEIGCSLLLENDPYLAKELLNNLTDSCKGHNISACYTALMETHANEVKYEEEWVNYWVKEVIEKIKTSPPSLTTSFQKIFVTAFKIKPIAIRALTEEQFFNTEAELETFLACINYARRVGLDYTDNIRDCYGYYIDSSECWKNLLSFKTLEILKTHQSDEIRVLALAIVVDAQRSTEPFKTWELEYIGDYLYYNINTENSSTRMQIVGLAKKAVVRINDSLANTRKSVENIKRHMARVGKLDCQLKDEVDISVGCIEDDYAKFWVHLFEEILLPGLNPDCNHSRKSACLELLNYIRTIISSKDFQRYWTKRDINKLKHILQFDTYERNKELASQLLIDSLYDIIYTENKKDVTEHFELCFRLMINKKPALTESAAYMLRVYLKNKHANRICLDILTSIRLLDKLPTDRDFTKNTFMLMLYILSFQLQNCYRAGTLDMTQAAMSCPIHGYVFCIRHLLKYENLEEYAGSKYWFEVIQDIITVCFCLIKLINIIICNDSPEGYVPEDLTDELQIDDSARAQLLTVYGWRAAKEISLLLGEIALRSPIGEPDHPGLIDSTNLNDIGVSFFNLLINTKHRGAFEQASIGFSNLCSRLWRHPLQSLNQLPKKWLNEILALITSGKKNDAGATRRSAGIPFIIQAILTTEPNLHGNVNLHQCLRPLVGMAFDKKFIGEQQIHCLNILRALIRNTQLGDVVMSYSSQIMMIAIEGFASHNWGVQNSSTLLFSAIMVRIFGVQRIKDVEVVSTKNKMLGQVFFTRYPELHLYLLSKLSDATKEPHSPCLYPTLLILSRLHHSPDVNETYQLELYIPYIDLLLANPIYRIRELAARTYCCLITEDDVTDCLMHNLLTLCDVRISDTLCHGILLQLHYMMKYKNNMPEINLENFVSSTCWVVLCLGINVSYVTAKPYLEILSDLLLKTNPEHDNKAAYKLILQIADFALDNLKHCTNSLALIGQFNLKQQLFNLKLLILVKIFELTASTAQEQLQAHCDDLIKTDLENHPDLHNLVLSYTNYLKYTSPEYELYNIFKENDSEFSHFHLKYLKPMKEESREFLYAALNEGIQKTPWVESARNISELEMSTLHDLPESVTCFQVGYIRQWLLEYNTTCCQTRDDTLVTVSLAVMDKILSGFEAYQIRQLNFDKFVNMLLMFSSPSSDSLHRYAVARMLVNNKRLFYDKAWIFNWSNICVIWEIVFVLLEDEDEDVRNTVCELVKVDLTKVRYECSFVPKVRLDTAEYARETLLNNMVEIIPNHCSILILLSLILRSKEVDNGNVSEVFDEGEVNTYSELYPLAKSACKRLVSILWKLDDGLNFDDKSIFIEEQVLMITTLLYDKFFRGNVPMLSTTMTRCVRNVLARSIMFLERNIINEARFKMHFRCLINHVLHTDSTNLLDCSEMIRLELFLSKIFNLSLKD